jgi:hypothetical protein
VRRKHEQHERERIGNLPQVAKHLGRCRRCGIEGRTVEPVPPGTPYAHQLKVYYQPLRDGLCAECYRVTAEKDTKPPRVSGTASKPRLLARGLNRAAS